jgi:hypothetical protein
MKEMEKEYRSGLTAVDTKVIGKRIKQMVKED